MRINRKLPRRRAQTAMSAASSLECRSPFTLATSTSVGGDAPPLQDDPSTPVDEYSEYRYSFSLPVPVYLAVTHGHVVELELT